MTKIWSYCDQARQRKHSLTTNEFPASQQPNEQGVSSMSSAGALASVVPNTLQQRSSDILSAYLAGEKTKDIAARLKISPEALYMHLLRHAAEEWKDHQAARALWRFEKAQEKIESCADMLALGRAREELKSAQWALERVAKRIYAPSQELTGKDRGPLTVELVSFSQAQIEGEVVREPIADAQSTAALPNK